VHGRLLSTRYAAASCYRASRRSARHAKAWLCSASRAIRLGGGTPTRPIDFLKKHLGVQK